MRRQYVWVPLQVHRALAWKLAKQVDAKFERTRVAESETGTAMNFTRIFEIRFFWGLEC